MPILALEWPVPTRRANDSQQRGFTLIELLVVLVLMGLVAGMVLPNLEHFYNAVLEHQQRQDLITQQNDLSYRVYLSAREFQLAQDSYLSASDDEVSSALSISVPDGWQVVVPKPIQFHIDGSCEGGALQVRTPNGAVERWLLHAPDCRVDQGDA